MVCPPNEYLPVGKVTALPVLYTNTPETDHFEFNSKIVTMEISCVLSCFALYQLPPLIPSIFLSVFDVHVNRTPIAGQVLFTEGRGGLYLDARKPEASFLNESLYWVFGSEDDLTRAVGVKQITGAIARRIVPWAVLGETMERGERFGMIRFGSRTALYFPLDAEVLVSIGQKVKGGETPAARMAG